MELDPPNFDIQWISGFLPDHFPWYNGLVLENAFETTIINVLGLDRLGLLILLFAPPTGLVDSPHPLVAFASIEHVWGLVLWTICVVLTLAFCTACWPDCWKKLEPHFSFKRQAIYGLLIPLSLFMVDYGAYFWPNIHWLQHITGQPPSEVQRSNHPPIRLMTWNIHKDTLDAIAIHQTIIDQAADIVAIQELGPAMANPLAIALRSTYPYQVLAPSDRPDEFALFSRYPIDAIENDGRGNPDCACQVTTLHIHDQPVTLLNVHLPLPKVVTQRVGPLPWVTDLSTARQRKKLDGLIQRIQERPESSVALGDFNLSDRHVHYRLLSKVGRDAFRDGGLGFGLTYPAVPKVGFLPFTPIIRLDYIWFKDPFTVQRAWTGAGAIADHQFVVADLNTH